MLNQQLAAEVLSRAVRTGGDFGEIFLEDRVNKFCLKDVLFRIIFFA